MKTEQTRKELKERIKELENKLLEVKASEERFRSTFDQDQIIKLLIDPDNGDIIEANKAAAKFYGYSIAELTSMKISKINSLPEKDVFEEMKKATEFKNNYFFFKHIHKNGSISEVAVYSTPVEYGGKKRLYSIIHDITEQKQLENKLIESQKTTEMILRSSSVGLAYAVNRKIIWANEAMETLFGYKDKDFAGKSTRILYANEEEYLKAGKLTYDREDKSESIQFNCLFKRKDGSIFTGHYKINFIDANNPDKGLIVSILDISELLEYEKKLQIRNTAIDSAIDGIGILDDQLNFIYLNKAYARVFGYEKSGDLLEKPWKLLYNNNEIKRFESEIFPDFFRTGSWRGEANGQRKDNSSFPQEVSLTRFKEDKIICVIRDISERKKAEDHIQTINARSNFLLESTQDMIKLESTQEAYNYIAAKFYKLIKEKGLITIVEFKNNSNKWSVKKIEGLSNLARKINTLLGFNMQEMEGEVKTKFYHNLGKGKLSRIDFDFPAMTSGKISNKQGKVMKRLLGVKSIYAIPIIRDDIFLGAVNIAYRGENLDHIKDIIEALVSQISTSLEKLNFKEQLQQNLKEKEIISDNVPNIIWKADAGSDGKLTNTYISGVADEFLGLPSGSINNDWEKYFSFVKPDYLQGIRKEIAEGLQKPGSTFSMEYEVIKSDGSTAWFQSTGRCYLEQSVKRIYGYTADISERRETQKEIEENERMLNLIFNTVPDPITIIRLNDGICLNVNEGFSRIIGYTKEETLGKTNEDLELWVNPAERKEMFMKLGEEGYVDSFEAKFRKKNGNVITALMSAKFLSIKGEKCVITISRDITERKEAELAIKTSEEKYHSIFLNAPIGIFHYDTQGVITDCNGPFVKIIGSSKEKLVGLDMIQKLNNKNIIQCVKDSLNKGVSHYEDWYTSITGNKTTFVNILFRGLKNEAGKIVAGIGLVEDITARKKAEKALQESEEKYRNIITLAPVGFYQTLGDGSFSFANQAFAEILNYRNIEELKKKANMENVYFHEGQRDELINKYDKLRYGQVQNVEVLLKKKGGESVWVLLTSKANKNEKGETESYDGFVIDISGRKENEAEIMKLKHAIEQSPANIVITDKEGKIQYTNPAFTETTGYQPEEVMGQNPRILQSGEHDRDFYRKLWETISKGSNWIGEFKNRKKDGGYYWESSIISPVLGNEGDIVNYIAIKQDITEQKKAERELIRAKEKAEQSDKLKSAFLASMSHELRTPLNAIIGFSDLLLNGDMIDEKAREFVDPINSSGKHLLEIIQDLFDISTLQTGESQVKKSLFSINGLFEEINRSIKDELVKGDKIKLDIQFMPPDHDQNIHLNTDKNKVKRVLINLLNNAIKFTQEGYVKYGYKIEGKDILFFVQDSGIGIAKDKQEIIFERFRQVEEASSTRQYQGIGLGLSICHKIAELLEADIWVESKKGKGSNFYFRLNNMLETKSKKTKITTNPGNHAEGISGKTILAAEDEQSNRLLMDTIISKMGARVILAGNGQEALDIVRKNPEIDLVLMDIKMPVMNGFDATRAIHKIRPELPVIALTAFAFENDRKKAIEAGCIDYASKPVSINELRKKIKMYIQTNKSDK